MDKQKLIKIGLLGVVGAAASVFAYANGLIDGAAHGDCTCPIPASDQVIDV